MNKNISDSYDCYIKIIKVIEELGGVCKVEEGASEAEISRLEQAVGYKLPEDYKDWLRLTKGIDISFESVGMSFYMADEAFDHEDGFKGLLVGEALFRDFYINLETGKFYIYDDDFGTEEFDSFEDLLDSVYYFDIENSLENAEEAEGWEDIYDEMFPEDK